MNRNSEISPENAIVKVSAKPNASDCPYEYKKWQRFVYIILPWLKHGRDLARIYTEAKVDREEAQAKKIVEEATKIKVEKDILKQQEVKEFVALVDDIFAKDDLPLPAKMLKIAKLLEANPQIMMQLEKINDFLEKIGLEKEFQIDFTQKISDLEGPTKSRKHLDKDKQTNKLSET